MDYLRQAPTQLLGWLVGAKTVIEATPSNKKSEQTTARPSCAGMLCCFATITAKCAMLYKARTTIPGIQGTYTERRLRND